MILGYAHLGASTHGVSRYGRLLAAEARRRPDLSVMECDVTLTGDAQADRRSLKDAGRQLSTADVVHIQYNCQPAGCVWGHGWRRLLHLEIFARAARTRLVATLHDLPVRRAPVFAGRNPIRAWQRVEKAAPQVMALGWLERHASRLLVCSDEERARTKDRRDRVRVVPHFVEPRELPGSREHAKEALGLQGRRVVTLLGYIHPRKGHALMVEALASLPADVTVIFAGRPPDGDGTFVRALIEDATTRGVFDRVRITGFLPEASLETYLAATDLAVCPFESLSASGSLSTWLSVGRPILASDLPQIAEYNAIEPGASHTFRPYDASALAGAIHAALAGSDDASARDRLRGRLLLPSVFDRHLEIYCELIVPAAATGVHCHA
jgi:glycosyltransferase involved in cell wall biosynthesis